MIAITGATGQLGQKTVQALLKHKPANEIVALVRDRTKAKALEQLGVQVRIADYDQPETLRAALTGIDDLLLISSSEVGKRIPQHRAVVDAAVQAGVGFIAYTSLLRADTSVLKLAAEHKETEAMIQGAGLSYCFLRNGWYSENYTSNLGTMLQTGALATAAGDGKYNLAARQDYAEAAAVVISDSQTHRGKIYELAGDKGLTMADFAASASKVTGKTINVHALPEAEYKAMLMQFDIPEPFADILANSEAGAAKGGLQEEGRQLSKLIGRETTPVEQSLKEAFAALSQ